MEDSAMAEDKPPYQHVIIRNTFVEIMDENEIIQRQNSLRRSNSDSSLSRHSYMSQSQPSSESSSVSLLWSQAQSNENASADTDRVGRAAASPSAAHSAEVSTLRSLPSQGQSSTQAARADDFSLGEKEDSPLQRSSPCAPGEVKVEDKDGVDLEFPDGILPGSLMAILQKETQMSWDDLLELERGGFLTRIPRNEQGEISSLGSLRGHFDGTCVPCIFWFRGQCVKSMRCTYCHFRHPGQKAKRHKPNKRTRQMIRAQKAREGEGDADAMDDAQADEDVDDEPLLPGATTPPQ
eukprot:TRINITY_DN8092_c0_g2_i1.p1 TRINITY_DN8092_c0_g2~~TRINITY_DN8092_c0_g2_i1.p1  ORF type:complete len:294 (-),score=61.82 TRINITY_DN8092_c0_g2_i1:167-1048(-)